MTIVEYFLVPIGSSVIVSVTVVSHLISLVEVVLETV